MTLRRLIAKLHYLGGLTCFWYLLVLGISSLQFNHPFSFRDRSNESTLWRRQLDVDTEGLHEVDLCIAIRDSLTLIGWPLPWEIRRDSGDIFHFSIEQPAKRYEIDYSSRNRLASVREIPKGFWRVFNALHGAGDVPNAPFTMAWSWYTRCTIVGLICSVFSGIYIWYINQRNRKSGFYILLISLGVAMAWMFQLYMIG